MTREEKQQRAPADSAPSDWSSNETHCESHISGLHPALQGHGGVSENSWRVYTQGSYLAALPYWEALPVKGKNEDTEYGVKWQKKYKKERKIVGERQTSGRERRRKGEEMKGKGEKEEERENTRGHVQQLHICESVLGGWDRKVASSRPALGCIWVIWDQFKLCNIIFKKLNTFGFWKAIS